MAIRLRKRKNYTAYEVYWIDPETKQRRSKHFYDKKEARDFDKLVLLELEKYRLKHGLKYRRSGVYKPKEPVKLEGLESLKARCAELYADNRVRIADIFDYVMEAIELPVRFKDVSTTIANREKGKSIPAQLRAKVLARDGYRCKMCGASAEDTALHVDHVIPVARGGITEERNLQTLCRTCNLGKGALPLE